MAPVYRLRNFLRNVKMICTARKLVYPCLSVKKVVLLVLFLAIIIRELKIKLFSYKMAAVLIF